MKNFGEELAYWYFRLNGFFLIDNFVLHRADLEGPWDADSDLIGIRNPQTVETIGLAQGDICEHLSEIAGDISTKQTAVICEVKAGSHRVPLRLGNQDRLRYALKRIGMFSPEQLEEVQNCLMDSSHYEGDDISVYKIVVSQFQYWDDAFSFISLQAIEQHIIGKFAKYQDEKHAAWTYFPSSLMQYLIWKCPRVANGGN